MDTKGSSGRESPDTKPDTGVSIGELLARGFYALLPMFIIGLISHKLIQILQEILSPVLDLLPGVIIQQAWVRFLLLCLVIACLLILVGVLTRRRAGQAAGEWLESRILNKLPFYSRLRGLTTSLSARDDTHSMRAARITVDIPGLEQLGVILERHEDGSATVFLPSSPNASSGTVVIVEPARIRELNIPLRSIIGSMGRFGHGTAALLKNADRAGGEAAGR